MSDPVETQVSAKATAILADLRYLQPIIQAIIVGVMSWLAMTVQNLSTSTATLTERVASLQKSVDELKLQSAGQYTRQDANRDLSRIESTITDLNIRLRDVEKR